ncbi:MAG: NAD-dependent protein deacylase [Clostridia bacterium]|nr:NAD-dependent protein deacylase [Clostridia bacterium]
MKAEIQKLSDWINSSERIVFFGGAGVSTESGIPDFRSADGLYMMDYHYPPEQVISHSFFLSHPEEFYTFYRKFLCFPDVQPNAAHLQLAALEQAGRLKAIVTQNIDGLHTKAGSRTVYELHGSVHRNYCMKCGRFYDFEAVYESDGIPRCACGGMIKPDVVLYEEPLDGETISNAVDAIAQADLLIVAGTSLTVYPAAGFLQYFRGDRLVIINRDATHMDGQADLVLHDKVGEVLRQIEIRPVGV